MTRAFFVPNVVGTHFSGVGNSFQVTDSFFMII